MNDPSSNEVSIRASITNSSLSVGAKSRAVSAIDQLVGGLLEIPTAWLEGIGARIRNRTFRESFIQQAAADRLAGGILDDETVSAVVAEIALCSKLEPTTNRIRVTELAIKELQQNNVGAEDPTDQEEAEEIDRDWLNHFAGYAERASSEGVRNLWARVLA